MKVRRTLCRAVVVTGVGILTVAGCAGMRSGGMSSDAAIAERQELMKQRAALMRSINAKLKAGDLAAVATDAEALGQTAKSLPALFPAASTAPQSRAKPEIWERKDEFDRYNALLGAEAAKLARAARANDASAARAALGTIGKGACGACHTAFRGPEIKK